MTMRTGVLDLLCTGLIRSVSELTLHRWLGLAPPVALRLCLLGVSAGS